MSRNVVIFDDACSMCTRSTRMLHALDWFRRFDAVGFSEARATYTELASANIEDGLRVRFPDGSYAIGIDAVRSIAMRTPVGIAIGCVLYVPPLRAIAARGYRFVAKRRRRSCDIAHG